VLIDEYVIMPNHFHGIVIINHVRAYGDTPLHLRANSNSPNIVRVNCDTPLQSQTNVQFKSPSKTIGAVVRGFKSAVTKQINQIRQTTRLPCMATELF
jgi:hypothetical protein